MYARGLGRGPVAKRRILKIKAYRVPSDPLRKFTQRAFRASNLPPRDRHGQFRKRKPRGTRKGRR